MDLLSNEIGLSATLLRYFPEIAAPRPQPRPGYESEKYHFSSSSDFDLPQSFNGYQLAFHIFNWIAAPLARDGCMPHSFDLQLVWPFSGTMEQLEQFLEGLTAVSEQWGMFYGSATASLGDIMAVNVEMWALFEISSVAEYEPKIGDVLFMLQPPGEAAAGRFLLEQDPRQPLALEEVFREQLISAYLQPPALLIASRILRSTGTVPGSLSLNQGLWTVLQSIAKSAAAHGVELTDSLQGSPALRQAAGAYGLEMRRWILWGKEHQLLWILPENSFAEARNLLWNRLEIEAKVIGRIGSFPGVWIKDVWGDKQLMVAEL